MGVARKMSVKIPSPPGLLETIGLCQVFRGSLELKLLFRYSIRHTGAGSGMTMVLSFSNCHSVQSQLAGVLAHSRIKTAKTAQVSQMVISYAWPRPLSCGLGGPVYLAHH